MHVSDCYPPLRLNVCPRCEYSLAAHPPSGVCPECGRAYEADEIVLYGYALGQRATGWNTRPPTIVAIVVSVGIPLMYIVMGGRSHPLAAAFAGTGVIISLAIDLWRRHAAADGAGLAQVKLSPRGFHQGARTTGPLPFAHADTAPLRPWRRDLHVRVNLLQAGRVQLIIARNPTSWWPWRREFVNADLAVEPGQLDAISRRISVWLGDTGRSLHAPPAPN
jgi:hypothetical protein